MTKYIVMVRQFLWSFDVYATYTYNVKTSDIDFTVYITWTLMLMTLLYIITVGTIPICFESLSLLLIISHLLINYVPKLYQSDLILLFFSL